MSRRRRIVNRIRNNQELSSFYDPNANNIAFIIPVTSRKRNYKNIQEIDFFRITYNSFLKTCEDKNYNYSFYLGYDDDDKYYQDHKLEIEEYFKSLNKDNKLYLIEIKGLQGKVGQIWSRLAEIAAEDNDFLYQIGDDIEIIDSGWEEAFISKLKEQNYIGVVGPHDLNNAFGILTQSFVHITHLNLFGTYYPEEIENWYIDDWITKVYNAREMTNIKVKNIGGCPRYDVVNNKKGYLETLKRSKEKFDNLMKKIKDKNIKTFKSNMIKLLTSNNNLIITNNRVINYESEIYTDKLDENILKEYCYFNRNCSVKYKNNVLNIGDKKFDGILEKSIITEDDIVEFVKDNGGILHTRKYSNLYQKNFDKIKNLTLVCLTGYDNVIRKFFNKFIDNFNHPIILITLETDGFDMDNSWLNHPKLYHWYTWNKKNQNKKVSCIPIGVNKDRHFQGLINYFQNKGEIIRDKLLLANYGNTHHSRKDLDHLVKNDWKDFCHFIDNIPPKREYIMDSIVDGKMRIPETDEKYYHELAKFKFVISPRGAGEDCHRTWEALYLGVIPIVKSSSINEIYQDLPILIVKDWKEVNQNFLENKWLEFKDKKFNMEKITLKYWLKKINKSIRERRKIHFITYGNHVFKKAKKRILKEAENFNQFDSFIGYGPEDLDNEFSKKFSDILSQPKGGGYWLWKPHIIKKELEKLSEGDLLFYVDAGCSINPKGKKRFNEYIDLLIKSNYGIISFQMHDQTEKWWTPKEIFSYFNVDVEGKIGNSGQHINTVIIMKKGKHLEKIIDLWLKAMYDNLKMFTDKYDKNQYSFFRDTRHEQSVLSLITKIHGSEVITIDETFHPQPFGCKESLRYPIWATRTKY